MLDFDLQMRFWRGVSDAMLHGTEASLAAASAMQDEFLKADKVAKPHSAPAHSMRSVGTNPTTTANPMLWWLGPWQAAFSAFMPPVATMCQPAAQKSLFSANPYFDLTPWIQMFWRQPQAAWPIMPPATMSPVTMMSAWGQGPAAMLGPFANIWPWSSLTWAYMQTPLTAMMMSAGMPYTVASPSAKASTAAMDAAHAARQQMDKVYSAYRSDGGHAAAQIAMMPWTIAATFFEDAAPQIGKAATKITRH